MGNLTKNLSRSEFACECGCGFNTVDFELVKALQEVVDHFSIMEGADVRINITGPNRCAKHNEKVQKEYNPGYKSYSSKTQHINARASDFKLHNRKSGMQINPDKVAQYLEEKYPQKFGIGRYRNRTHLDTRSGRQARWGEKG